MNKIMFSWDENKAQTKLVKHKISFNEAMTVLTRATPLVPSAPAVELSLEKGL